MRVILTSSNEFLFGADIEICSRVEDVYKVVESSGEDDTMMIYVDVQNTNESTLKQLELFRFEFTIFNIILDRTQSIILELSEGLNLDLYSLTPTTQKASDLFLLAEKYKDTNTKFDIEELTRGLDNKAVVKNLVEYDFPSYKTLLQSLIKTVWELKQNYMRAKTDLEYHIREKETALKNEKILKNKVEELEESRETLTSENFKLKFNGFLRNLSINPVETTTPIVYVKCILPREDSYILLFFRLLNDLMRSKYNKNSCLLVIEDESQIKLKKLRTNYTYVSAEGNYNMNMGDKIITTPQYVDSLMEHFESFAGVKDLFIVVDLTLTTSTFVVGEGAYVSIENDRKNDIYSLDLDGIIRVEENEILESIRGEDDFNIELNLSKSEIFLRMEEVLISAIV